MTPRTITRISVGNRSTTVSTRLFGIHRQSEVIKQMRNGAACWSPTPEIVLKTLSPMPRRSVPTHPSTRRQLDWVSKDEIYVANFYRVNKRRVKH